MNRLGIDFYNRPGVTKIARELIGKILVTQFGGIVTSGRIVETEAYAGIADRASHAYGGRRTARTEVMFGSAGHAYVYLCYGIHHLFNIITNNIDVPHAILVRALEPLEGVEAMLRRTGKREADYTLTRGPGNVSKALGIHTQHTGISLQGDDIFIATDNFALRRSSIVATPRLGVDYAGAHAQWPYRFILNGNPYVSGRRTQSK